MYLPTSQERPTVEARAAAQRSIVADRAAVDPAGRLMVRFAPRDGSFLVRRLVVQGPAGTVVRVYAGEPDQLNLADATATGTSDVADYAQPLYVPPSVPLVIVWTDVVTGGNVTDPDGVALARAELEDIPG